MDLQVKTGTWQNLKNNVAVIFAAQGNNDSLVYFPATDFKDAESLALVKNAGFSAALNEVLRVPVEGQWILLVGLGKRADVSEDCFRQAAGTAAKALRTGPSKSISFPVVEVRGVSQEQCAQALVEGALLSTYRYEVYKKPAENLKTQLKAITLLVEQANKQTQAKRGLEKGRVIADAVQLTRDLINGPSNLVNPTYLAKQAEAMAKTNKLKVQVLSFDELKKKGFGGLVGVSQGSAHPAKFIVMDYKPVKAKSTLVLCGKGVTFDTGGISLKPALKMELMKYDMSGAAAVFGTLKAVSELKLPHRVVGVIAATENMPSGTAQKPGDIIKTLSGKTVEVLNTDAEGRLILADCLHYAKRFEADAVIDLATLTGACIVALGSQSIALMSTNDKLANQLVAAGERTQERMWRLPLWEAYGKQMESDIADLRNISGTGEAGTITAAKFLEAFTEGLTWAHLDIASTAWTQQDKPYSPKGAVGIGVRLLVSLIEQWKK